MSNIYSILDIGKEAILTQRLAIDVTGHNISNVNTEGYSRQRVNTAARIPVSAQPGQIGRGVEATSIQRIYDRFINDQINEAGEAVGRWDARKRAPNRASSPLLRGAGDNAEKVRLPLNRFCYISPGTIQLSDPGGDSDLELSCSSMPSSACRSTR